jgi:alanyl-tRNA synthetase
MKQMTSAEVRQAFLDYFVEMNHTHVASSSLVPANDPTLLFANSGMVQFKDVFLGTDKRDYKRATTAQKSMRVSGKHNDLENVGPSARHHTFFEMLGNFSFGDYFKRDAIRYAWDLVTKVFGLPAERIAVTVYTNDDEAFNLWTNDIGLSPQRVTRLGAKSNFWQMAETGPCGPCSEIFWDKSPELGEDGIQQSFLDDDDRFLEIWNLVFMQFNRKQPDPQNTGAFDDPLPNPCVDTGMGLERIVMILQNGDSNYDTDLFMPIIRATQALSGESDAQVTDNYVPYRVIADHIRAAVFLISDGVLPGAKGRDSVCRLVLRRAARFGKKIGFNEPFLHKVAQSVIDNMGHHYTELVSKTDYIKNVILVEEERFLLTLEVGLGALDEMLAQLPSGDTLSGEQAFYLKATLGLPFQVTKDICEERGYSVDETAYLQQEDQHSLISGGGQAMGKMESAEFYATLLKELQEEGSLDAHGVVYNPYSSDPAHTKIVSLVQDGHLVNTALVGEKVEVVLGETHFYVEAGGQVSDTGVIQGDGWLVAVEDVKRPVSGLIVHFGEVLEGNPQLGEDAKALVALDRRSDITRNHTGTHLLHAALRNHLGGDVHQRGSLVSPERLRFDFSYDKKVTLEELREIEQEINHAILHNYPVVTAVKSLAEARNEGAMALFGEKYGDTVRTVSIGDAHGRYSYELCGGVHVAETAEIGAFIFTSEGSVSAGIRRVEALTGREAIHYIQSQMDTLQHVNSALGGGDNPIGKIETLQAELAQSRKQVGALQSKLAKYHFDELVQTLETLGGKSALIAQIDGVPADTLREMADWFRNKVKENGVLVVGADSDGKPSILVAVTDDLVKSGVKAGDLIKPIAAIIGGGGGGRPNMAQAGGKDSTQLPNALAKARELLS